MSATVIFPNLVPSIAGFNINYNTNMRINKINGVESITENPGERWAVSLTFRVLKRADGILLRSHLNELRGHVNKSVIKDLGHDNSGTLPGAPKVDGASQYGMVLNVKGLPINQEVCRPGQRFKLGTRLHEIARTAQSDGAGNATIHLANEIVFPPGNNQTILTGSDELTINCRWADPRQITQLQGNRSHFRNVRLTFVEALI